ncbi:thioredoxin domain-containing protein [Halobacteriales archaeon QS_1_68_17]|nr:MAG: thioredoxin domain-containing protein [Halobacteriales archaeon QS_1_68_17]
MSDASAPTSRNRLDEEESPYLRQHADNPVNWQPWDETALEAARERDVPIFLSIGYSACHWCHVMEDESFQDEAVAELLNEHFVPIKVDREERPDVDSVYQTICQMTSGRGGWPLSVWLTPDGRPFYVGTYYPPEPKRGMPGFRQLLSDIVDSWNDPDDREEIENRADQWERAIEGELEETPDSPGDPPGEGTIETAARAALRGADREHGGWGNGPKFPQTGRLHVLARASDRTGRDAYREVVVETLDAMATGGMYDHLGGGFHRYATDNEWVVPHFEKMLYDNAELPRTYLAGYQLTGTERYADVARETLGFVARELQHDGGAFFSTLDAQSGTESGDREEGAFYVWTPDEVRAAMAAADDLDADLAADLFCDRYGVTERGNFEGATVLTVDARVDDLADEYDRDAGEIADLLARAERAALEAREDRPRPRRDEKVLAGWNGLMISAYAEAGIVLDESEADPAVDALAFLREHLWDDGEGRLFRRYKDGDVAIPGYLEDYAFLGRGAFDLYQATGDVDHLAFALDLARVVEEEFWDADRGTLYFTPESGESLVARPQELNDQSTPSSAGVATRLLLALDGFVPREGFADIGERVLETHGSRIESNPLQHASLVLAADDYATGAAELTVAADSLPATWRERIGETYLPNRILSVRPPTEDGLAEWLAALDLSAAPPRRRRGARVVRGRRGVISSRGTIGSTRRRNGSRQDWTWPTSSCAR